MVVLILVLLWVAVLTPRVVRRFREGSSHSSIESFHEQLHLLERAGPKLVRPAYRLEVPDVGSWRGGLSLVEGSGASYATPRLVRGMREKHTVWERRRSRRRRRDLLLALLGLVVLTGGLGALHALHLLWAITGISAFAIAGYVALVAYAQMLHADRDAPRPVASSLPRGGATPPGGATVPGGATGAAPHWSASGPMAPAMTSALGPGVALLASRASVAARAGYPGAWDDEDLAGVSQGAVSG